jgi:hypothetical protein
MPTASVGMAPIHFQRPASPGVYACGSEGRSSQSFFLQAPFRVRPPFSVFGVRRFIAAFRWKDDRRLVPATQRKKSGDESPHSKGGLTKKDKKWGRSFLRPRRETPGLEKRVIVFHLFAPETARARCHRPPPSPSPGGRGDMINHVLRRSSQE